MFYPIVTTVKIKGHSTDGVPLLIQNTVLMWYIDILENLRKGLRLLVTVPVSVTTIAVGVQITVIWESLYSLII